MNFYRAFLVNHNMDEEKIGFSPKSPNAGASVSVESEDLSVKMGLGVSVGAFAVASLF